MDNIKKYYTSTFPTDELGAELNQTATFSGLYRALDAQKGAYKYIGVTDSLIRERLFERLAEIIGCPYDDIYIMWALSTN